jgi:hypothetical protein
MIEAVVTTASSATSPPETRGRVLVSGSYGGEYNAWHAVRQGAKAVILNDAGGGRNGAGIAGLPWLDQLGVPGATADCMTCHIGDGEHMLAHGRISHVNAAAARLGCAIGQSVAECAAHMQAAPRRAVDPPANAGGKRFVIAEAPGQRRILGLDAAPLMRPDDAGAIAITGSHAALFRGRPDNVITVELYAVFFNDAGGGLDDAGIARLADLDRRGMIAATVSADSAEIGHARSAYDTGVISHANLAAIRAGVAPGTPLQAVVHRLARMADPGDASPVRV